MTNSVCNKLRLLRHRIGLQRIKKILAQCRQSAGGNRVIARVDGVERRHTLQLSNRVLEGNEYFRVAVVVVQIHDGLRKTREQLAQNLSLHGGEIEESIDDEKLHF